MKNDHVSYIPDDGEVHSCVCGNGEYRVWDFDGYRPKGVINDDPDSMDGLDECYECGRFIVMAMSDGLPDCDYCGGERVVGERVGLDDAKLVPCPKCVPEKEF